MYIVYVLWSASLHKRYTGSTGSIELRFRQHEAGKCRFTKGGRPWIIIHIEEFETLSEARMRELFLKSGAGRIWLDERYPHYKHGSNRGF